MFPQLFPANEKANRIISGTASSLCVSWCRALLSSRKQSSSEADVFKNYFPTTKDVQGTKLVVNLKPTLRLRIHGA
jgi:hypothetical protein